MKFVIERVQLGAGGPSLVGSLVTLFGEYGYRLNRVLPTDGSEGMKGPLPLAVFTVGTLPPAASFPFTVIGVSDGAAGAQIRASNGTAWVNLG